MKLYGVCDIQKLTKKSKRWVQLRAAKKQVGVRVSQTLVFTPSEVAILQGKEPPEETILIEPTPALRAFLMKEAQDAGITLEEAIIERLNRSLYFPLEKVDALIRENRTRNHQGHFLIKP